MKIIHCSRCSCPTAHELIFDPLEMDEYERLPNVLVREVRKKVPNLDLAEKAQNKVFEISEKLYMCMQCGDYRWEY